MLRKQLDPPRPGVYVCAWHAWLCLAFLVVVATPFVSEPALAASFDQEVDMAEGRVIVIYTQVRNAVLFLSGLALFGCGVAALTGRMPWKWFWTLGGGIFLVAVSGILVNELVAPGVGNVKLSYEPVFYQPKVVP